MAKPSVLFRQMLFHAAVAIPLIGIPTANGFFVSKNFEADCGKQMVKKGKIIGGSDAYIGEFPFIVSIRRTEKSNVTFCAGAILSQQWILTAAHCVYRFPRDEPPLIVYFGECDSEVQECRTSGVKVAHSVVHPEFKSHTFGSDIALLRLEEDISLGSYSWPVCLPLHIKKLYDREATVVGWGLLTDTGTEARTLQKVTLPVLNVSRCQEMYDEAQPKYNILLQQSQMCAGYAEGKKDTCQGDSGGPLFVLEEGKFTVIGLVSAGVACALPLLPGIYTNVHMFVPWISDVINSNR